MEQEAFAELGKSRCENSSSKSDAPLLLTSTSKCRSSHPAMFGSPFSWNLRRGRLGKQRSIAARVRALRVRYPPVSLASAMTFSCGVHPGSQKEERRAEKEKARREREATGWLRPSAQLQGPGSRIQSAAPNIQDNVKARRKWLGLRDLRRCVAFIGPTRARAICLFAHRSPRLLPLVD